MDEVCCLAQRRFDSIVQCDGGKRLHQNKLMYGCNARSQLHSGIFVMELPGQLSVPNWYFRSKMKQGCFVYLLSLSAVYRRELES